jgi:hypothetical protein
VPTYGGAPDDDPGWNIGPLTLLAFLVPGLGMRKARRAAKGDPLVAMRQIFISFCTALVLFQVVLLYLPIEADAAPGLALFLLGIGAISCFVLRPVVEKPLRCGDALSLVGQFQTRMFVRIAFSEAAALFGFVGFFVANVSWVYPIGAAMAFAGFFMAAPSKRNLVRDQAELRRHGCHESLVRALRQPKAA